MIKVRVQLAAEAKTNTNPFKIASNLVKTEGFFRLYKGLDGALLRQITYTTSRMGVFNSLLDA